MAMNRRALIAAALVSTPVLVGATWFWAYRTCHVPVGRAAIKATNSIGCFEFWFNRYQTLLTGLAALLSALIATALVWRQLKEMSRQSAASIRPAMHDSARELEAEFERILESATITRRVRRLLAHFDEREMWPTIYREWSDECSALLDELEKLQSFMSAVVARHPGRGEVETVRSDAARSLLNLLAGVQDLQDAFRRQTTGPRYDEGEQDLAPADEARIREAAHTTLDKWQADQVRLAGTLNSEVRRAWQRLRELERFALGQRAE